MSEALELPRLSEKLSLRGSGTSCSRKGVSRGHRLRDISDWLWFLRGGAQHGKILIAIFRGVFASANKIFVLAVGLGTRLSFHV